MSGDGHSLRDAVPGAAPAASSERAPAHRASARPRRRPYFPIESIRFLKPSCERTAARGARPRGTEDEPTRRERRAIDRSKNEIARSVNDAATARQACAAQETRFGGNRRRDKAVARPRENHDDDDDDEATAATRHDRDARQ